MFQESGDTVQRAQVMPDKLPPTPWLTQGQAPLVRHTTMVGGVTALPAGWVKMPRGLAGVGRAGLPDGFESRKVRSSHAVFQVQVSLSAHPLRRDDIDVSYPTRAAAPAGCRQS